MPTYNQNSIFYTHFTNDVNDNYRLFFHRGHSDIISTPDVYEFPAGFIYADELTLKSGMPDDMPFGLQLANTTKLKVNFARCVGDYAVLKDWIFKGNSNAIDSNNYTTLSSKSLSIPNRWTLCKVDNTNFNIVTRVLFDGVQDSKGSKNLTFNAGSAIFEFELIGIEKYAYTAENITDILDDVPDDSVLNNAIMFYFYYGHGYSPTDWIVSNQYSATNENRYYFPIYSLIVTLMIRAADIIVALRRNYHYITDNDTQNFIEHLSFYEQGNDRANARGSLLSMANVLCLALIANTAKTEIIGGMFSTRSDNGVVKEYNNLWDFLKFFADTYPMKILFHNTIKNDMVFTAKVYDGKYLDTNIDYKANRNITIADMFENQEFKFEYGNNVTNLATYNIKDVSEKEYVVKSSYLNSINETSYDIDAIVHNCIPEIKKSKYKNDARTLIYEQERARVRQLYYVASSPTSIRAVHTNAKIDLGDSIIFDSTTSYSYTLIADGDLTEATAKNADIINSNVVNAKNNKSIANAVTNAIVTQFGSYKDNVYLELDLNAVKIDIANVGDTYTIDLNGLSNITSGGGLTLSPPLLTKAICVSIEQDVLKNKCKCKFFIRGI